MARFITLHTKDHGAEIDLNVRHIEHFSTEGSGKGSYIQTTGGNYGVNETPDEIRSLLKDRVVKACTDTSAHSSGKCRRRRATRLRLPLRTSLPRSILLKVGASQKLRMRLVACTSARLWWEASVTMSIQIQETCPACGKAKPTMRHLQGHKAKGELVQVSRKIGKQWGLVWEKPVTQKASAA